MIVQHSTANVSMTADKMNFRTEWGEACDDDPFVLASSPPTGQTEKLKIKKKSIDMIGRDDNVLILAAKDFVPP